MIRTKAKLANVKVNTSSVANSFTLIFPEFEFLKLNIPYVLQIKLLYLFSYKYINIALVIVYIVNVTNHTNKLFIVNKLMMRDPSYNEPFDEMDLSALKEIGNIIAASYLSALSSLTNLTISPSVPHISVDMAAAILSVPAIQFGQYGDNALLIETQISDDVKIKGYFILMPDAESYEKILSALGINF